MRPTAVGLLAVALLAAVIAARCGSECHRDSDCTTSCTVCQHDDAGAAIIAGEARGKKKCRHASPPPPPTSSNNTCDAACSVAADCVYPCGECQSHSGRGGTYSYCGRFQRYCGDSCRADADCAGSQCPTCTGDKVCGGQSSTCMQQCNSSSECAGSCPSCNGHTSRVGLRYLCSPLG
jgi:hypothetical protein